MQFIHDIEVNSPDVIKVTSIEPLGDFDTTRPSLQTLQGTNGDLGVDLVNGYTTSFTAGLSGPNTLYRLTLQAVDKGTANVKIAPAAAAKFAAGTPQGLKLGHTNSNGDPNFAVYPDLLTITVVSAADLDGNGVVNYADLDIMCENWLETDPNLTLLSSFVGHWKMNDDTNNTTVLDSSGNNNHGTAQHNTEDINDVGKINAALLFNGTSDFVDIGNVIGTAAYTKAAWVKRASGDFYNNIISSDAGSHAFWAPYHQSFKLSAGHNDQWYIVQDSQSLQAGLWYQVAVTFDPNVASGRMVLYKNGADVDDANNVPTQTSSTETYIGKYADGYYFAGSIDNVMIFDKALTAQEIQMLYNSGNGTETIDTGALDGDINGDTTVDLRDFAPLAEDWQG